MSIIIQKVNYIHPDHIVLFDNTSFILNKGEKAALVGANGSGKSTLLKMIAGEITPTEGTIQSDSPLFYVPQHFGQYNDMSVAQALGIAKKLKAFHAILQGDATEENFTLLNDDWDIEERCNAALSIWGLSHIKPDQAMSSLSGGEKTKAFLAGMEIHQADIILMDEPTNHLDWNSRKRLYNWVENTNKTLLVVSHDITLLRLLPVTYELEPDGITAYGGNYDFFKEQKNLQLQALQATLDEQVKQLKLAKKIARETAERKQKHESRGKKQNIKKGVGKMAMDTLQDKAEKSATKLSDKHAKKTSSLVESIEKLRSDLPDEHRMKIDFSASSLHKGKILVKADTINYAYGEIPLWDKAKSFILYSGDRFVIKGNNGSGKTTLIKLITGSLSPLSGSIEKADFSYLYIDQDYSLIQNELTVYEQAQQFNTCFYEEHEIKMMLSRYLFPMDVWDKPCEKLSGGEKMRLVFCCLMISNQTPDMFILDEPTNNLDIQSVEIITSVIKEFTGTLLVVSHDQYFLEETRIDKSIEL